MKDENNNINVLGIATQAKEAIDKLIPFAPPKWKNKVAELMGVTVDTVNKLLSLKRPDKQHRILEVLMHLKRLVEEYKAETKKLIA